jgi:hypothetical protein
VAYTPNEHPTTDEQLVVLRGKCPFHMFIKSKPGKYGIKLWLAADAKNFYACNMQEWWSMGEEARPSSCNRYGLSHVWNRNRCYY